MSDGQSDIDYGRRRPVVLVGGRARAGKDLFAEYLCGSSDGEMRRGPSTSEFFCRRFYLDDWRSILAQCKRSMEGRALLASRMAVYNGASYNYPYCRLYAQMVSDGIDIIVGIRRLAEVEACVKHRLVTHAVWVERDVPRDTTLEYTEDDLCNLFGARYRSVPNSGGHNDLLRQAGLVWDWLKAWRDQ